MIQVVAHGGTKTKGKKTLSSALTIENSLLDQQKQGKNMERRQKMERTIVNNGSLMDVRIGIIRQDYNPVLHGSEISFYDHEPPLFQRMDGEIIPDIVRETAILRVFGFDEPEDGCAFELTCDGVSDTISGCVFGDNESLYEMIKNALLKHITSSNDVAESIVNILSTAYGYGFDSEEIQEEAFDTLENVKYLVEFDGAEMLYLYDSEFAGGIFVEVNPFNNIPCTIENNGKLTFSEDIDWDEYREESERFVFVIRGH